MTCLVRDWRLTAYNIGGDRVGLWWPELWGSRLDDSAPMSEAPAKDAKHCSPSAAFSAATDPAVVTCQRCWYFYQVTVFGASP